ncbi:MAG: M3 family metallopeptidase [Steroidobacteraceae bacterium]
MERREFVVGAAVAAAVAGCSGAAPVAVDERVTTVPPPALDAMLAPWTGPHGGLPRFDLIEVESFKPALMRAMDLIRTDIEALTALEVGPTFANTVEPFEDAGRELSRALSFFGVYRSNLNDENVQALETEMSPVLAAFDDEVIQNPRLFRRLKAVYESRAAAGLTAEQRRLTEVHFERFERRGAALAERDKTRLKEINQRLAALYTVFSQNLLADEEAYILTLDGEADLGGVPEPMRASAAQAARDRGLTGKWVFTNTRSSMEPFLSYSSRRDLREKGWRMWVNRGNNDDARDNKQTISEILRLRAERAQLLGYQSHAHWMIANNMARTPDAALALMLKVWKAAAARAREEVADMQALADEEADRAGTPRFKIEPWDHRYFAEKVRLAKYAIDQNEVKQYLQLDKMREGMFWAANQVYRLEFVKLNDVPVFHPDVTVYEVRRTGQRVGLWYFDPYARKGKRSGAWMTDYRAQERFKGDITPIVSNNSNFVKGQPGEPVLVSWDDANTMFHEFGHALHGLLSNVSYPSLSGTNVKRDFVEFPSQVNEYWFSTPELLSRFAVHYQTGKPIPQELVDKVLAAQNFNQGFATVEYLASALYDMKIHLAAKTDLAIDPADFEKRTMAEIGCPPEIVMRHRPTQFSHIFSGDGYSAGYYVYIWADAMTADVYEGFMEKGGLYDQSACKLLEDAIMSVGNSIPPDEAFRRFRGRDVDTDALMRDRGFPVA